jgi:hypothetical protein
MVNSETRCWMLYEPKFLFIVPPTDAFPSAEFGSLQGSRYQGSVVQKYVLPYGGYPAYLHSSIDPVIKRTTWCPTLPKL